MRHLNWLCSCLLLLLASPTLRAEDWPQWLGPQRDGVWREKGLLDTLPKEGLKVRWRVPVGMGYAGPAVADGKVILMDRVLKSGSNNPKDPFDRGNGVPGFERVLCFDEKTGKPLWDFQYDCTYTVSYAAGPRCTPAIEGDRVYTYGTEGDLHCLDLKTGKKIWGRRLTQQPTPMWGYTNHPLIDGDLLYITVADPKGILYALKKETGELAWKAIATKECGYSPPMIFDVAGKRQLIQWYPAGVSSIDPATGKVFWTVGQEPMRYGVTIVTPLLHHDPKLGDVLLVTSQYGGALLIKLDKDSAGNPTGTVVWHRVGKSDRTSEAVQTLMATPIVRDGHIYGIDVKGQLRCLDLATGDRFWETFAATTGDAGMQSWATAFMTPLGDDNSRTLLANEHGDLILADLTPQGYKEIARTHLLDPTNTDAGRPVLWSHPAYADKSIFWKNDKELVSWSYAKE